MAVHIKAPHEAAVPFSPSSRPPSVEIRHPDYDAGHALLFRFPAFDDGIEYNIVWTACCIVLGNAWTRAEADRPYLSLTQTRGSPALVVPADGILSVGAYYLHDPIFATDEESPYPITPNFHHWEFPHNNVPSLWLESHGIQPNPTRLYATSPGNFRDKVLVRDESCRMTLSRGGVEQAYWVPISADDWFNDNMMERYHSEDTSIGVRDLSNTILLRADVHKIWDSKDLVMHMLSAHDKQEKLELWHNRQPHTLYGIRPEFVFARFAWTIFNNELFRIFNSRRPQGWKIRVREDDPKAETRKHVIQHAFKRADIPLAPFQQEKKHKRTPETIGDLMSPTDYDDYVENPNYWFYSVSRGEMVRWSDEEGESDGDYDSDSPRGLQEGSFE
ncbi:uncharacterized protein F4812DRAFT_461275 [Daldinia caldariorum]|uniref:uncharacterized protein n=1 Tax=Daldinia caldariorum TaxID=326644 RepID=UPI00200822CC|nr:uncharacterized protein F4812DRAFT_461275 [Daldinia caldariorum]KAI1465583.1 hypothetical protein F4812DRAFT_461275 [Daldinia caldariorum]